MYKIRLLVICCAFFVLAGCEDLEVPLHASVDGEGTVVGTDILCGDNCDTSVNYSYVQAQLDISKKVTLTAEPAAGYELFSWVTENNQACADSTACKIEITAGCELNLNTGLEFPKPCFELKVQSVGALAIFVPENSVDMASRYQDQDVCMISSVDEVLCWSIDSLSLETNAPMVTNPTELKVHDRTGCVRDDTGIQCWGDRNIDSVPPLTAPEAFKLTYGMGCVLDLGQVVCWGATSHEIEPIPALSNAYTLWLEGRNICVVDDDGVHCWGDRSNGVVEHRVFENDQTAELSSYNCMIVENELQCEVLPETTQES